ncbi:efflux RND transporter periplasmic adaptor subunit [Sphingobacterium psychroaquaticum]|uniref:Membrane fusion protein, multidrug efflux system n=1 Tax=Sphingobacterium psychroaquaticum TaxID=561061 RepID=A0A1X7JPU1_9SPHI|nr:efflux RND transporter periplasmic adaptor subunit [Sphingobacterium psychroaquaticum]QBQ40924.1 efflux RND transporter periplasmic adaptor subunit [Sphingobacterium psychroaquaticum]SMG29916.1 membrane fusion protein, multidrug efflux system [Sphingobacterium psychroaquaticum]
MKRNHVFTSSLFFILSLLVFVGCRQNSQGGAYEQGPAEVPMGTVTTGNAVMQSEYAASIEGVSNIEIRPQVSGYLSKILVDEGDYVRAGQPLFKIEDRVYQEQLNSARASVAAAEANLVTAKINLDRKQELVKSKIVSDLQVQEADAAYNAARASVAQAKSAVESARINVDFSVIKAPVSGYIGRFNYRLGSLLSPTNQLPITVVSDNHQVYTYFSLSENDFATFQRVNAGNTIAEKLRNTAPVSLLLSDGLAYGLKGKIDAVEGQFNKSTGSITLRAKFDNPKVELRSGNTGKIVMEREMVDVVLFPIASTVTVQDKVFAYTVDKESKVLQIPIGVIGKSGDNFIITDGLKAGDKFIAKGFERLQTGMPVVEQKQVAASKSE